MRRRDLAGAIAAGAPAALLVACGGNAAGTATTGAGRTPAPASAGARRSATIELEKGGSFTIELFTAEAPRWTENFIQKAGSGFYRGLTFHRVEDWVVQGGDPNGNGTGGGNTLPTEVSKRPFTAGSAGVARRQDPRVSNDAQFFIVTRPGPAELGGKWTQLDEQYTHFGQVTEGMDTVRKIVPGDKMKQITIKG